MSKHASKGLVIAAYDQTHTQGVADSVVKYLRRDHGYTVLVVGPGHERTFEDLTGGERAEARFLLELDAVSGVLYHTAGLEVLACPKLAWFVDSHKKPHFHHRIAADFDVVFFTMRAWSGLFGERGRWLPVHYDADYFSPREAGPPRFDVGFVGSQPRDRTGLLQDIARRHDLSLLLETTTGPREKELTADLYSQCRIVFNQHVANDLNFRTVEAPACRRLLLTDAQRNGQYELFRDREHVVFYKDDRDLEDSLLHYLRHDEERERIATAGYHLVRERHTTSARVRELVAVAEQLVERRAAPPPAVEGGGPSTTAASPRVLVVSIAADPDCERSRLAREVARGLVRAGVDVDLLTLERNPGSVDGVTLVSVDAPPSPPGPYGEIVANVALVDAALAHVRTKALDAAVAVGAESALTAASLPLRHALVLASTDEPASSLVGACEAATAIVATSAAVARQVTERCPLASGRMQVLDPGQPDGWRSVVAALTAERPVATLVAPARATRYDHEYMRRNGYCVRKPEEARLKRIQAGLIARVLRPRRALVAGCAAGELLLPLLALGVDAHGFDFADDLDQFVYPEVKERVRHFDVARVGDFPFEQAGGRFDTFVAIDLFEHVDEAEVDAMLDGATRRFEQLAVVISSSPDFEGHICVHPFPWWLAKLEARGFELLREPARLSPEELGTYGVRRFDGVKEDMSEQLVFFRRRAPAVVRRPKVSIGVVCCDRPDVLKVTLETTRAALSSFAGEVEWIAYDNGSKPAVRRVLDEAGVDLVLRSGTNRGLAPALDALYREARGELFMTLEDDWECLAEDASWLELAIATLETQPDVGVVRLRKLDDDQCGHWKRHRLDVALRHHPWSIRPLPDVVETREVAGQRVFVASARFANWTTNPTLCRREVRDWLGPMADYLPDPRDHRPNERHPGLEGGIDLRWRSGPWKVAKLLDGPFTHIGHESAVVAVNA